VNVSSLIPLGHGAWIKLIELKKIGKIWKWHRHVVSRVHLQATSSVADLRHETLSDRFSATDVKQLHHICFPNEPGLTGVSQFPLSTRARREAFGMRAIHFDQPTVSKHWTKDRWHSTRRGSCSEVVISEFVFSSSEFRAFQWTRKSELGNLWKFK